MISLRYYCSILTEIKITITKNFIYTYFRYCIMIQYVLIIFLIFSGLMMLPGSQIIPTTLAQENSITETNAANTTETNAEEEEEIQGVGTISRRGD